MAKAIKVDELNGWKPPKLTEKDLCFYYLIYTPGGYSQSDDNSFVKNFKKDISYRGTNSWYYRENSIKDFAKMIHKTLQGKCFTIIPCATSKPRGSINFNDRLDATAKELRKLSLNYDIQFCIDTINECIPAHNGGSRKTDEIKLNTCFIKPTKELNKYVVLIDDVITTGAHFRAYKDIILEYYPNIEIIGLFLARFDGSSIHGNSANGYDFITI